MIRVMVVEDEPPIARSIKRLAEEYGGDVQVEYIAINGRRALEYLESHEVDLIFSDIKMPVMDGLELAKHISVDYPDVIMVIISGFQEFEFARTAIRYGVNNYLLKPISRQNIYEVLDTAKMEIARRYEENKRMMLERAMSGEREELLNGDETCGVALLCMGAYPLVPDSLLPDIGSVSDNSEIEEYVNSMLPNGKSCIYVNGKSLSERALVFPAENEDFITGVTRGLYEYLYGRCDLAVTLVVCEKAVPINLVGKVIGKLRKKLYMENRLFISQYLFLGESRPEKNLDPSGFGIELIQMLKTMDLNSIRGATLRLVETLCANGARQNEFVVQFERLMVNYFDGVLSLHQLGELKVEIQAAITTSVNKEELAMELADVLFYQLRTDEQMEKGGLQTLCEDVAAYIRLHHRDNITTIALGQRFGLSSTQLAKKFKNYFGISISEYLNKYRVELAQTMMRDNKKLMVKEVALEVGYNDQYYFSKTFKKFTGVWPTEYHSEKE